MDDETTLTVATDGRYGVTVDVPTAAHPDLADVDAVARACLAARRAGGRPHRVTAGSDVVLLLHLAGLGDVVSSVVSDAVTPPAPPPEERQLFVNLPVADVAASRTFFTALGFDLDDRYTDDATACVRLSEHAAVLLVEHPRFRALVGTDVCETRSHAAALLCISCEHRQEVDTIVQRALANGGTPAGEPRVRGELLYAWSFRDPDGHHWEVLWLDPGAVEHDPV